IRATLRLSSPDWLAQPRMTSSMPAGSIPARSTSARTTVAARSSGRTPASAPPCLPTGVRSASMITASFTAAPTRAPALRQVHPYRLYLGVSLERVHAEVAAEARLLEAAEGRRRVVHVVGVDPDGARLDCLGRADRLLDVARPDARR